VINNRSSFISLQNASELSDANAIAQSKIVEVRYTF